MCGIAGFLGAGSQQMLEKMTDALSRRGPDDRGLFFKEGIALGHRRLAVIELSSLGHQPMRGSDERTTIVFNGEIYNYKALREEIEKTGLYVFRTMSDTEVILAAYQTMGVDGFARLDGMFAFALYDARTEMLYLVRDRFGKKPLYWGLFNDTLLFGSELKALMPHEAFRKEIDPVSLSSYLARDYVPTPRSIFKNVQKLEPASYLSFKRGGDPVIKSYWKLPQYPVNDSFAIAVQKTDKLLSEAVGKRLMSDVPLGVFLSGGIDSSAIAYHASRFGEVHTFSIGFDEPDFDESQYAREAARAVGTKHHEEIFSSKKCIDAVPEVFSYLDEPIADASILPTYLLSSFTRKHVTVALGGDGGDELFAGYPTFDAETLIGAYTAIPTAVRHRIIEPLVHLLPASDSNLSFDFKLKRFVSGAEYPSHERHERWLGSFGNDTERTGLLRETELVSPYGDLKHFFDGARGRGEYLNRLLWSYARGYLMDEVLVKVDRASMAHALEARTPFLDTALAEYVFNLPYHYKHSAMNGKRLLKASMRGKLPDSIIDRKKKGFGIPLARWLRADMNPLLHQLLSVESLEQSGVFNHGAVARLIAEHESGAADHRKKLWNLMVFQMWHKTWAT